MTRGPLPARSSPEAYLTSRRYLPARANHAVPAAADNNGRGHVGRVGQEGTEEPGGDDLQSKTDAVVIAAPIRKELAIGVVEIEVARELRRSRLAGVAAIAPSLVVSEEFNRHGVARLGEDSTDKVT